MTVKQLLRDGERLMQAGGCENAQSESLWLLESVLGCRREYILLCGSDAVSPDRESEFLAKVGERVSGRPIQYILGSWDFMGNEFSVGEGVLIPRPETELLIEFAESRIKRGGVKTVLDLCAGSGCIGLSVAKLFPECKVYLVEKSEAAFAYLTENRRKLGCANAELICGDIFDGFEAFDIPQPDIILSNPPYIESGDIPTLQREVLREPAMALDGGEDGMDFYRAIAERWLPCCKAAAVECGEGQASGIKELFSELFAFVDTVTDFGGIERAVIGEERKQNDF